ncbi:hypothetical protein M422DRAFT_260369 [Sphaerobolus stellatus SS14]|uniref:CCHC-type domain-containing protein n=1 Tax=Sphaerobolus stellatus (strain SS14) TaxID=990650 RepID=A0A0C9VIQ0_SPHS4|nr:hypothetical protein M422DRAFT_260369 [Sphaerobolus stellatus SS14]
MSNTTIYGQLGLRIPGAGMPAPTQGTGEGNANGTEGVADLPQLGDNTISESGGGGGGTTGAACTSHGLSSGSPPLPPTEQPAPTFPLFQQQPLMLPSASSVRLFVDPTAKVAISHEPKKSSLPPLQAGFKANPLELSILSKVKDTFRSGCIYVPYITLTHVARLKAYHGKEDFILNASGGLTTKGLDHHNKRGNAVTDWHAAAKITEAHTHFHHGDEHADALMSHHNSVMSLSQSYPWDILMAYDISQQALSHIVNRSSPTAAEHTTGTPGAAATPRSQDSRKRHPSIDYPATGPARKRLQQHCFQCGNIGHIPGDCKHSTTVAGKPDPPMAASFASTGTPLPIPMVTPVQITTAAPSAAAPPMSGHPTQGRCTGGSAA